MVDKPNKGNPSYTSKYIKDPNAVMADGELVLFEDAAQSHVANSQRWLVSKNLTDLLGSKVGDGGFIPKGIDSKPELEKLGFKVIGESGDPLFYDVEPPRGWTKSTDGYHTYIKDERGRVRAYHFFKGAAYDYRANLEIRPASVALVGRVKVTDENFLRGYNQLQDTLKSEFGVPHVDILGKIASEMTAERYAEIMGALEDPFRSGKIHLYIEGGNPAPLKPVFDYLKRTKEAGNLPIMASGLINALNSCTPSNPFQDATAMEAVDEFTTLRRDLLIDLKNELKRRGVPNWEEWINETSAGLPKNHVVTHCGSDAYRNHRHLPSGVLMLAFDLDKYVERGLFKTPKTQKIIADYNEQRELLEKLIEREIGKITVPFERTPYYGAWYQLPSGVTLTTNVYQPVKVQITDGVGKVIDSSINHPDDKIEFSVDANGKKPLEEQLPEFDRAVDLAKNILGFSQE